MSRVGWRHGTCGGYTNHGCRCDDCRAAFADWMRGYRERRFGGKTCVTTGCERSPALRHGNGLCDACHRASRAGDQHG